MDAKTDEPNAKVEGPAEAVPVAKNLSYAPARPAKAKRRHFWLVFSFLISVLVPCATSIGYLYFIANDQYGSTLAFSVRSEEPRSPLELLGGGLGQLSTGASADSDILYEFIQSQKMVENIQTSIDLKAKFSRFPGDRFFSFNPDGPIEDLVDYWRWMVVISYDSSTQLAEIVVKAFTPEDAQQIAQEIQRESTKLINALNVTARRDATVYAKEELARAVDRLKIARAELTQFRTSNQMIDPSVDLQGQMGLLSHLEEQLAAALIDADLLVGVASSADPRLTQASRRIEVIKDRIAAERTNMAGANGQGDGTLSTLVGEFERLMVEQKFSEETYLAALVAYDSAVSTAQRQSRYLAAHIEPTLAESAKYPQREMLSALIVVFAFLSWAILVLI